MIYKNCSGATRTFYGVEFKPGSIHVVPGAINAPHFVQLPTLPEVSDDKPVIKDEPTPAETTEDTPEDTRGRKSRNKLKEAFNNGSDND